MASLIADPPGGVRLGVHGVSGHHDPVQVEGFKQDPESRNLWLDLPATRSWVSTAPVAWSKAARRCGAGSSPVRAPRMVLPSTAITVRPLMVPVRVHNHDLTRVLRSVGSRSCRTRRIVDCRRQGLARLHPQRPQVGAGQVGGVLPYRRQAPAAGQHPGDGQGQYRGQASSAGPDGPWDQPRS